MKRYGDPEFPFLYETHLHTSQSSACSRASGSQMARACHKAGYTGIIVTDHFLGGNCVADATLPWADWVREFCTGYHDARAEGQRLGLQVFFGWEQSYDGNDFLIYGLDEDWLLRNPAIATATVEEQFRMVDAAGGLVVQAHPFREDYWIPQVRLFPQAVHAAEVINASHRESSSEGKDRRIFNQRAADWAAEQGLPATAGSDVHSTGLLMGGMAFRQPLRDIADFVRAVKERRECRLIG